MAKKRDILDYIRNSLNATDLVLVEDFDACARHVCFRGSNVQLLPYRQDGITDVDKEYIIKYYQCMECGKVIVVDDFM